MATSTAAGLERGHIGLNVTDLARSARFYREALGLDLVTESGAAGREYAFLARDGRLLLTLWRQSAGTAPTDRPGLHHLSFQVDSIEEVRAAEERSPELRTARIRSQAPVVDGEVVEHDAPRPERMVIEGTVVPGDPR